MWLKWACYAQVTCLDHVFILHLYFYTSRTELTWSESYIIHLHPITCHCCHIIRVIKHQTWTRRRSSSQGSLQNYGTVHPFMSGPLQRQKTHFYSLALISLLVFWVHQICFRLFYFFFLIFGLYNTLVISGWHTCAYMSKLSFLHSCSCVTFTQKDVLKFKTWLQ